MRSHLWLILCVVLCTTYLSANAAVTAVTDKDIVETTKKAVEAAITTTTERPTTPSVKTSSTSSSNEDSNSSDTSEDDYYEYDEYYDDNELSSSSASNAAKSSSTSMKPISSSEKPDASSSAVPATTPTAPKTTKKDSIELKPIVDKKNKLDEADEDDYYEDDSDDSDDSEDTDEISFNEDVPCPRDCICRPNVVGYNVATCSRLDPSYQKFGLDITDLEVIYVPPKFPIVLGAQFFKKIGLEHVRSIKIAHSTIQNINPSAFEGLNDLHAVNLTNVGLDMIHPDTFAENEILRILTLSNNDLHAMQKKMSPFVSYMIKSPSIEELDISNCNLKHLLPTAFNELPNIVYINLANNQLETLPADIFNKVETIEELDLSSNVIKSLPSSIFNRTSLTILNLKYNEFASGLTFGTPNIQKLDLSYNQITDVNNAMFNGMPGLTSLILKGNLIKRIHQAAFHPLIDLRNIDISFNQLEQVSSLMFLTNADLDVIRMNDNPHLKKLPLEGFECEKGQFSVYLFDASNCDLSELGDNTFVTMPDLSTLNLAWNNVENLGKNIFSYCKKLIELDLSNNLLVQLEDLIFLRNLALKKLNLAGNPLQTLSAKVFLPTKELTHLDISDCELRTIFTESSHKFHFDNVLQKLKTLNVSNNEIERVFQSDLNKMANLNVFDVSNNRLRCDNEFKALMKWLDNRQISAGSSMDENAELQANDDVSIDRFNGKPWDEFMQSICKKESENLKSNKKVIDTDQSISEYDEDSDSDSESENDVLNKDDADDEDDEDDDDESAYTDEDERIIEELEKNREIKLGNKGHGSRIKEKGFLAEEIPKGEELDDDIVDLDENNFDIMFDKRRPYIYYGQYRYLMPILIIVFCILAILILIGKIVSVLMRRRGERYRQALLASKNSIVYQKLSEDIGGPTTPKFHRYAPINQV